MTERLALFIDYQNAYMGARRAFFDPSASHTFGQFDPVALGAMIAARRGISRACELHQVRIYAGRPSSNKEPRSHAAHIKQCGVWMQKGALVRTRDLRYPRAWPKAGKAEEKGIDVQLAIDFVMMKLREEYDAGVIFSADTDLVPALEAVCQLATTSHVPRFPEVAAWGGERTGWPRLRVTNHRLWCHWIDREGFEAIADARDYNLR